MTNKWISEANACDPRLHRNASVINYAVERVNIEFHFIANPLAEFFILNLGSLLALIVPPTLSTV